jgi:starch synthase
MLRILFVTSEAYPLMKTGGLGDVSASLPAALKRLQCDVRVMMPAYRDALARAGPVKQVARLSLPQADTAIALLQTTLPGTGVTTWLIDGPSAYDRPGNPYMGPDGKPWPDNARRFALLGQAAAALAAGDSTLHWQPQLVHCHDWQSGLTPALLSARQDRPATVFTIHNLAYQGLFDYDTFIELGLPRKLWSPEALEFYGRFSFIKGGLCFADHLTTVSPTYAKEIQAPAMGFGLDGLLRHRASELTGILNGIDERIWNPATDRHLAKRYDRRHFADKVNNKLALQHELGLPRSPSTPLLGTIGRLVQQKGIDLIVDALPHLLGLPLQLVVLGTGEPSYERVLRRHAARHPDRLAVRIGYDEALAHRIEGGADIFLMPSRFEPCGLNQLYSLRYGTVPIVHRVGGLADTVVDASDAALGAGRATGVVFERPEAEAMLNAIQRALMLYNNDRLWKQLALTGMRQSFTWRESARHYLQIYRKLLA